MSTKIAVMLDGGHVRVHAKSAGKQYDPDYIEKIGLACSVTGETIHRIMYYDCPPFNGTAILPVSGNKKAFAGSDAWLKTLSYKDLFCIRLGVLKFRGYVINNNKIPYTPGQPLTDADFHPEFEQKGVDMRIGIDMANLSANRSVDLIALATNDTDCIPAIEVCPARWSSDRTHYGTGLPASSRVASALRLSSQHRVASIGAAIVGQYGQAALATMASPIAPATKNLQLADAVRAPRLLLDLWLDTYRTSNTFRERDIVELVLP